MPCEKCGLIGALKNFLEKVVRDSRAQKGDFNHIERPKVFLKDGADPSIRPDWRAFAANTTNSYSPPSFLTLTLFTDKLLR